MTRGYKTTIRNIVHLLGGEAVDVMEAEYGVYPRIVNDLATTFAKTPAEVFEAMRKYRNSWAYQLYLVEQRHKRELGKMAARPRKEASSNS